MRSRSVKVSPMLFSIKHVVTAGHDYAVIMPFREALTCAGSVVFMLEKMNTLWIQKYITGKLIKTLGNCIDQRCRCYWILLTPVIEPNSPFWQLGENN